MARDGQGVIVLALHAPLARVAGFWLAFDANMDPERARARFLARYGAEPAEVVRAGPILLAGPVGEEE
ncbi:MAG TPA: hypothetical protein PLJ35_14765 [Anaerolineae bacterium]|nr:hypothetical protein [Anaerolineae bacterium]HOR00074.1 hypothetical protein [Anaerolineae bacterium]HPL79569.1 hypothetical protein [Burkholderiaceae bacterium]